MIINVSKNIYLEISSEKHAAPLFAVVDNNREHLSEFLPWVGAMKTADDMANYLRFCEQLINEKKEVSFVIFFNNEPAGRIGLHYMNLQNKAAAVGYWLSKDAQGNGIILKSCKKLIDYGFKELDLHRIELKAAVNNLRSRAVPAKLQFKEEGILRDAEFVNGKFIDLVLFSVLSHEWQG